jgi:uncharacterized repeat protein (TIGR03803 family)
MDGNLYGVTSQGGQFDSSTALKISPSGNFTVVYTFSTAASFPFQNADGAEPVSIVQAMTGDLRGSTHAGRTDGTGTIFSLTTNGTLTTLYSFDGTYGAAPTGLRLAQDGNFYGTTTSGGPSGGEFSFESPQPARTR